MAVSGMQWPTERQVAMGGFQKQGVRRLFGREAKNSDKHVTAEAHDRGAH